MGSPEREVYLIPRFDAEAVYLGDRHPHGSGREACGRVPARRAAAMDALESIRYE